MESTSKSKILYMLILLVLLIVNVQSFQLSQSSVSSIPPIRSSVVTKKSLYYDTKLYGIDFDGIGNDEECDFTDGDLSQVDLSKCLPFPSPDILAEDVVTLCMDALSYNDEPKENAGLQVCFNFSSDRCRAANGPSFEDFVHFAGNPIFRLMVNARKYEVLSIGPEMGAGQGSVTSVGLGVTRGAMKTVLTSVTPNDSNLKDRKFLWTLQKERRPPRQGERSIIEAAGTFQTML